MPEPTEDTKMDKLMEVFLQWSKEIMKKLDDIKNDSKLVREELRNNRTKEIKNDSKPET